METTARQRCDGSPNGVDAVLSALREVEADSPYAVLTTVDPETARPVSRAVRISDYPASASDFRTVRIVSRADTRKVGHASARDATACVAYLSSKRNACFTLTGKVAVSCMEDATTQNLACAEPVPKHAFGTRPSFFLACLSTDFVVSILCAHKSLFFSSRFFFSNKRKRKKGRGELIVCVGRRRVQGGAGDCCRHHRGGEPRTQTLGGPRRAPTDHALARWVILAPCYQLSHRVEKKHCSHLSRALVDVVGLRSSFFDTKKVWCALVHAEKE